MFDRSLFDRDLYDRVENIDDGVKSNILSISQFGLQIVVIQPLSFVPFAGQGDLNPGMQLQIPAGSTMDGSGFLNNSEIILRQPLSIGLTGIGDLLLRPTVMTPIGGAFTASGSLQAAGTFLYQHMNAKITGNGDINIAAVIQQEHVISMPSAGALNNSSVIMRIPLTFSLRGDGNLALRRLGSLNEDLFQLLNIDLQPGEEVTIDTDLLEVLFGYRSDVSSVTTDSVFFDLNPGENEISVTTDTQGSLQVTAIWQNRWL